MYTNPAFLIHEKFPRTSHAGEFKVIFKYIVELACLSEAQQQYPFYNYLFI